MFKQWFRLLEENCSNFVNTKFIVFARKNEHLKCEPCTNLKINEKSCIEWETNENFLSDSQASQFWIFKRDLSMEIFFFFVFMRIWTHNFVEIITRVTKSFTSQSKFKLTILTSNALFYPLDLRLVSNIIPFCLLNQCLFGGLNSIRHIISYIDKKLNET